MTTSRLRTSDDLEKSYLAPGDVVDGRYRIEHVLGEGTFASVYLARHATIDTLQCAIKVLKPRFVGDEELRRQFRQEAETVARLRDRHTVRVSDMGELPDGRPFICMEYCVGATLDFIISRHGPLPDVMVAHIARGVLHSLREAHDLGIVHRDIKPSNISLTQDPNGPAPLARVLDFGIAYVAQLQGVGDDSSESDLVFCTPSYAAPEVLRGNVTVGADLYALGLTMAELLEGEPVFPNTGFYTVAARQMAIEPVPFGPKTLASKLLPFLQIACEKDLDKRYGDAGEMLDALEELIDELDHAEMLTWSYFMPPNCVGVARCSLASERLDMALPAGCAEGCMHASSQGSELRTRGANGAPPAQMDFHEFAELQRSLDQSETFANFDSGEFQDIEFVEVDAQRATPITGHSPTLRVQTGDFEPARQDTDADAPSTDGIRATQTERSNSGTLRINRMALEDFVNSSHDSRSPPALVADGADTTLTARDEAQPQGAMRALLPSQPNLKRHARLIANTALGLLLLAFLIRVLLRGLPG